MHNRIISIITSFRLLHCICIAQSHVKCNLGGWGELSVQFTYGHSVLSIFKVSHSVQKSKPIYKLVFNSVELQEFSMSIAEKHEITLL